MAEARVDASFVIKIVLPEQKSELVREKWASWACENVTIIARGCGCLKHTPFSDAR
jgi:predicted nucleic acid-binding protein